MKKLCALFVALLANFASAAFPQVFFDGKDISGATWRLPNGTTARNVSDRDAISAKDFGMTPGTGDNASKLLDLMLGIITPAPGTAGGGSRVVFSAMPGQAKTTYYFSKPFLWSRGGTIDCGGNTPPRANTVNLVFAAGVHGVVSEASGTAGDGTYSNGETFGCGIVSLGFGTATAAAGSTALSNVAMQTVGSIPASTWSAGDGLIAYQDLTLGKSFTGYISGTTLTVTALGSYPLEVGQSVYVANATAMNTFIAAQTTGTPGSVGTYTVSQSQTVGSDGAPVAMSGRPVTFLPIVPPGAYVTAADNSAATLTLAAGFEPKNTTSTTAVRLWQLPAIQAFKATTVSGKNCFTVTSAPTADSSRKFQPGDRIWSQAFAWGSMVWSVTGSAGAQIVCVQKSTFIPRAVNNATLSAMNLSVWIIPSGRKFRQQAKSRKDYIYGFPFGVDVACTSGSTPAMNCTTSTVAETVVERGIIGFITAGNNTGASKFDHIEGIANSAADIVEGGTVGSTYVAPNMNSAEGAASPYGIIGNCLNPNNSVFVGGYTGTPPPLLPYCMTAEGINAVTATTNGAGQGALFIGNEGGSPSDARVIDKGMIRGNWQFGGGINITAYPCVLLSTQALMTNTYSLLGLSKDCTTLNGIIAGWNRSVDAYDWYGKNATISPIMRFTGPAYTGNTGRDTSPNLMLPRGALIGSQGLTVGSERQLDAGTAAPTASTGKRGDVRLNTQPSAGGSAGWIELTDAATFTPFMNVPLDVSDRYPGESIAAGANGAERTVTATGVALGDFVFGTSLSIDTQGCDIIARISAADTLKWFPRCSSSVTLGAATARFRIQKH